MTSRDGGTAHGVLPASEQEPCSAWRRPPHASTA